MDSMKISHVLRTSSNHINSFHREFAKVVFHDEAITAEKLSLGNNLVHELTKSLSFHLEDSVMQRKGQRSVQA